MPDGLLLLAFALTLVANAVLIAVAIRAMRPGGPFADESAAPRRRVARPDPAQPTPAAEPASEPPDETTSAEAPAVVEPAKPKRRTTAPPESRKPRRRTPKASSTSGAEPPTARGSGRRRRFSLPPLDDDHEKVNRSIESFLSGGESAGDSGADPGSESDSDPAADPTAASTADRDVDTPPTTVALVEVTGSGWDEAPPNPPDASAVAAVERALRGAARATDRVERLGSSRFRVVLAATGELAARAYLRRVRATTEPLLDELDPPRRLAVATATVLDEPVVRAGEIAERRLTALLEASRMHDRSIDIEPRAAGD